MNNLKREIAGFLMGEGCFRITRKKKGNWNNRKLYTPSVQISLRDDDQEILHKIKEVYGGCIVQRKAQTETRLNAKPATMWITTSSRSVLPICNDFLKCSLPSKKRKEVELLRRVCIMKIRRNKVGHKKSRGWWFTDKEYEFQEFAFEELKRLKQYKSE